MLKIRPTPTDSKQKAQMREWSTETQKVESRVPAIPYGNRDCVIENSQRHSSSNNVQLPLPTLNLQESENLEFFSENREESQIAEPLCTNGTTLENAPYAPGTCKSTHENLGKPAKKYSDQLYLQRHYSTWISGLPVENVEL